MDTPRICIVFDKRGFVKIVSDVPIRAYWVSEHYPHDRVCELLNTLVIGVENVHQTLGDSPVGHINDDTCFGYGYGPRKPPPRPPLWLAQDDEE